MDPLVGQTLGDVYGSLIEIVHPVRGSADFDLDCDVDLSDFALFGQCYGGAFQPPAGSCPPGVDADLDGDGDVDTGDFALFSNQYTGTGISPCGGELSGMMPLGEGMMGPGIGGGPEGDTITVGLDDSVGPNPNLGTYPAESGAVISFEVFVSVDPFLGGLNSQGLAGLTFDLRTNTGVEQSPLTFAATSDGADPATITDPTWAGPGSTPVGGFGIDFLTSPGITSEYTDDVHGIGAYMALTWDADAKPGLSGLQPHALHNVGFGSPPGTDVGGTTIPPAEERARWYLFSGEIQVPAAPGNYSVWVEVNTLNLIRSDVTLTADVTDGYVIGYDTNGDSLVEGSFTFEVTAE